MKENLMKVECELICDFKVQNHDHKEPIDITQSHAKRVHNIGVTAEEIVKGYMKPA